MTQTFTTATPTSTKTRCNRAAMLKAARLGVFAGRRNGGYTLLEALLVLGIVSIVLALVLPNLFGRLRSNLFMEDSGRFVNTLRIASQEAVYRGKSIAVVIDISDGYYTVYEATMNDVYGEDVEPLIDRQSLEASYIEELEFADGSRSFSGVVILYADPQGWRDNWMFTLIDLEERRRWVRCDLMTTRVVSDNQPLEIPRSYSELSMSSAI
ncbi:MAG: prepilin-type N-terminal cleavage/methylation domain-containing protein [Sedimentisphaerales bacterium]|nr:prepilin-type N-terminal cleavage/methylation domain-containing protein [Sedimentisphaerales bacterium]